MRLKYLRRITPACAGNSSRDLRAVGNYWDHPRLRGEQSVICDSVVAKLGSPPLARGTGSRYGFPHVVVGITPACAGNSCSNFVLISSNRDHPRLRGEQPIIAAHVSALAGSPPLARGTGEIGSDYNKDFRITPACAGNSTLRSNNVESSRDHPRLRGEQLTVSDANKMIVGSPPLARGTDCLAVEGGGGNGITPACAGNSPPSEWQGIALEDHPRLRGEQA